MNELLTSIINRPYVFIFLAAYLVLAWRFFGIRKAILWLISGYLIAWLSEFSSIHIGFPYGEYHYVYENMPGELMMAGVPFFDSLSYPFLIFAGFSTAVFILRRWQKESVFAAVLLGALLTMLLDVIIDPVATMGEMWFLGKIHYYAHPGWYFGVPLTNFGGWFLVAFAVIGFNALAWHAFPSFFKKDFYKRTDLLCPAFYASIALFNIAITFLIGQLLLGIVSSAILLCTMGITLTEYS